VQYSDNPPLENNFQFDNSNAAINLRRPATASENVRCKESRFFEKKPLFFTTFAGCVRPSDEV
jgi:hypothetical protein